MNNIVAARRDSESCIIVTLAFLVNAVVFRRADNICRGKPFFFLHGTVS